MSPMGDKVSGMGQALKKHLDKAIIAAMAVLLAIIGFLQMNESTDLSYEPPPPERYSPKVHIDRESPDYLTARNLIRSLPPFADSPYKPLVDFNMFDPKSQRNAEELQGTLDEMVGQGRKALSEGRLDEAESLAKRALASLVSHKPAQVLLEDVEAAKKAAAASAPGGGKPKPGAAAPKAPSPPGN